MKSSTFLRLGLVIILLCPLGELALADTYKWVDKKGVVHFTDNPAELPEPQRSRVLRELEQQEKTRKKSSATQAPQKTYEPIPPEVRRERLPVNSQVPNPDMGGDTSSGFQKRNDKVDPASKAQRKMWVEKADRARAKVSKLEKKCQSLRSARDESARKSLIFATPKDRQAKASSAQELKTCEQRLEKAKQYLEERLPEEARRAGVPPGWIR